MALDLMRDVIAYAIPFCMHAVGLYFLYQVRHIRHTTATGIQYIYLVLISISDLLVNSLSILISVLWDNQGASTRQLYYYLVVIVNGGLFVSYTLIMTLLTLDRFLEVYFSIRYTVVWSLTKTKLSLLSVYVSTIVMTAVILATHQDYGEALGTLSYYIWPTCEGIFIITAVVTYGYVIDKIRANRKKLAACKAIGLRDSIVTDTIVPNATKSVKDSHRCHVQRTILRTLRGFFIPSLFIFTFMVFWVLPDLIFLGYALSGLTPAPTLMTVCAILYALAPISDALIYIFFFKPVRKKIIRLCLCF